ncbi:MAG: CusA/CzcA family heavy metal efflux RND transporter, partial [Hymenobacteraceae bacterium]|nr:CusA/CzcA family heavy metal efflux RND transporter [Hymenobacteraceae bacterium]
MFDRIISFSIKNKLVIGLFVLALIGWGTYSLRQIPLDAVPDITNNQVQIITQAPDLATQEVEQFITYPLETSMSFIPDVEEVRSISRFGLSVITVVFERDVDPYLARQLVSEQIKTAQESIPEGFGSPQLAPMVTGLSEIYQYTLVKGAGYDTVYSPMELRSIQDWIVKRQLAGVPGVAEVSSFGGYLKQYEVALDPEKLRAYNLTIADVYTSLEANNKNTGGSYIQKANTNYFIRGEGMVGSLEEIRNILIENVEGTPILVGDVAKVRYGHAPRFGAITRNGEGESVGGLVLMLKGENSYQVTQAVKERVAQIQKSLPEGVHIEPFLDRSKLIDRAISTVTTNLIEGGLIVVFILVLLLGNWRAGLVVASVIPLAMLFALGMMNVFGVSANLMSLGAIDFGLIVDGAVIIVEAIVHRIYGTFNGQRLSQREMDEQVGIASAHIRKSAAFGEIIILIVYLPILALVGIEGEMFRPMAQTVSFAILGAFILSLTYVPMMSALVLKKDIVVKRNISDKIMDFFHRLYEPVIRFSLRAKEAVVLVAVLLFAASLFIFSRMGGEFIPQLEEGDIASHQILPTGTSLKQMITVSKKIQDRLMAQFPEVKEVVTKIGTSEIPTDPMPMELADIIIVMKGKNEWESASSREEMFEKMEAVINSVPGVGTEFTQPIQMRFNELISGVRQDIAVKIYGEDLDVLFQKGNEANELISRIEGVGGTVVEQVTGLPQIQINYNRSKMAQYGLDVEDVNRAINMAFAGGTAGVVFEGERRFDLVVR